MLNEIFEGRAGHVRGAEPKRVGNANSQVVVSYLMTVVQMSEKGQIVVPKEIRQRRCFEKGTAFLVLEGRDGTVSFRPVNPSPKLGLVEHLRRLKGLEIPEMHFRNPPRV